MRLDAVDIGSVCRILDVRGEGVAVRRAKELGLVPGIICTVIRKAPFSGPVEVATPTSRIGIRTSDELWIEVEPLTTSMNEAS